MLNYRPKSSTASQAVIDITVQNATGSSITMQKVQDLILLSMVTHIIMLQMKTLQFNL